MRRTSLLSRIFVITVVSAICINANGQRFSLRGQSYPNHGLVTREEIGETNNTGTYPGNGLHCIGSDSCCVPTAPADQRGQFVLPGTTTTVPIESSIGSLGYFRNRGSDRIFLNRRGGSAQGIFQCLIRTDSSQTTFDTFYVGVYDADSGAPTVTGVTYDDVDAVTCTSSGGPATSVTWRRNCVIIQPSDTNFVRSQTVTDTALATYENTLKLPRTDTDGVYTCSVSNTRGYSNSLIGIGAAYIPLPVTVAISASGAPVAGQSFTLTCTATTALSNPTYQWFSDNGTLIGGSAMLTINELLESNTGEYSCQVTAGSGASQRYGCGVQRIIVQAPSLTVTVNNTANAVAGITHTLSCSVTGVNLQGATVSYVWQRNGVVIAGATSSTYDIASVQVTDAGSMYSCQVTVQSNMFGSFGGSGSGTLMVSISNPTIRITRLTLETPYVGLPFMWRCEAEIPGSQLAGVSADIEWRGPGGSVLTSDGRITVGGVEEVTPGREYRSLMTFNPLSAVDTGSYNCSATIRSSVANSNVMNGVGSGSDTLTVTPTTVSVSVQQTNVPSQLLDLPSYNSFSLTCTATSRAATQNVTLTKEITWMRRVDGGNSEVLTNMSANLDVTMVNHMNLGQATATSELMVNTTSSGSHVYTCSVSIPVSPATDIIQGDDSTTITVQGELPPNVPIGLSAIGITHNSATIRWTVTSLAYGPEMYMVRYGVDMNNLDQTSDIVSSGGDITMMNFDLSAGLTGLQMITQYFYHVVATNAANAGGGMTSSVVAGAFNTSGLNPGPPTMLQGTPSTDPAVPPSINFTWAAPDITNGVIQGYEVTCTSTGLSDSRASSTRTSATVSALENGVRYCCTVMARNAGGSSMPSEPFCTTTVETAPTGPPQGFTEQVNDARNVTFTWTPPSLVDRNGNITSYNLTCISTTVGREAFLTREYSPADSNLYTLPGFRPNTMHSCSVFAINSAGRGPEASDSFTTLQDVPDGPPEDITVNLVAGEPSRLTFNFNPPREDLQNGAITAYRISCSYSGGSMPVMDTYVSSLPRPYTLSNLRPATQYSCSLAASTSVGFGVQDTVAILTIPDSPAIASITPGRSSLLVNWNYTNPPLAEGAVISGYRVYLNDSQNSEVTGSSTTQFNITSLSPFTYYSVQVSAYNTREDGEQEESPRSEQVIIRTLAESSGAPICPARWSSASLSSVTINWEPPVQHNGDITGYFLELVTYDNQTVLQSNNVTNSTFTYTFNGFTIAEGVPYHIRVYTEDKEGRGRHCVTTDFGDQLAPPENILADLTSLYDVSGSSEGATLLTWTVLPLDQAKGYISLTITFGPLTITAARQKRQTSGGVSECVQSPCQVPYEQGRVSILGLNSEQDNFIVIVPENEEGEIGTPVATTSLTPSTDTSSINNTVIYGMAVVLALLLLLLCVAVVVIVVLLVKQRKNKRAYDLSVAIPTSQCEAYEVMKLEEWNSGPAAGRTGTGVVGMGFTSSGRRGQEVTSQLLESSIGTSRRGTQFSEYAEVGEMLKSHGTPSQGKARLGTRPGTSRQLEESYSYVDPIMLTDSAKK